VLRFAFARLARCSFSDAATSTGNQTVQTTRQSDAIGSLPQRMVQPLFMALGTNRSDIEQAGSMAAKDATAIEAAESGEGPLASVLFGGRSCGLVDLKVSI
jgi:hypothetical protein